jgi:hypothetical protein
MTAVRQKIEAEQALAASIAQRKRLEWDSAASREKRAADSAELRQMRKSHYVQAFARLMLAARSVPALLLVAAFALGIGVSAVVSNSLLAEKSAVQASAPSQETDVKRRASVRVLKMDDDLSGFSARVSANPQARPPLPTPLPRGEREF